MQVGRLVFDAKGQQLGNVHPGDSSLVYVYSSIMTMIVDNLQAVRARIVAACAAASRDPAGVRLMAVSKTFGPDAVIESAAAAQRMPGENYIQEGVEKILAVRPWVTDRTSASVPTQ